MIGHMEEVDTMTETSSGFQPARFDLPHQQTSCAPSSIHLDAISYLPAAAGSRLTALRQRCSDLHSTIPQFEEIREAQLAVTEHEQRIRDLTMHPSEGGVGLAAGALQVVSEQKLLDRAKAEVVRLKTLQETRRARWSAAGQLEQGIIAWLRSGVPGNCQLVAVDDAPLSKLLVKNDGGRIEAAVGRYRLRLRELAADRARLNSAPWPSAMAKAAARALIDRLADAGTPNFDAAIEHGQDISFATTRLRSMVHNVPDAHGAVAYAETVDSFSTMCWLFRDQLLAKIDAGLDEIADDKNALSSSQREQIGSEISASELSIQRAECSLIWHAEARGEIIDFRSDTSPESVLGVQLETRPKTAAPSTSPSMTVHHIGPGR
jgi:hypothetical protein